MKIKNIPSPKEITAMKYVAEHIFEKVREHFGKPIKVSSFYRCPPLNKAIGGSETSQHCLGEAIDMDGDTYGSPTNKQIFEYIRDYLNYDQLIVEGITNGKMAWVHCSCKPAGNKKEKLFMHKDKNGKSVYDKYTDERYAELIY